MRISDRSSDVCSSDLHPDEHRGADELRAEQAPEGVPVRPVPPRCGGVLVTLSRNVVRCTPVPLLYGRGIGVSGRARWQIPAYVALVAAKCHLLCVRPRVMVSDYRLLTGECDEYNQSDGEIGRAHV